MGFGNKPDGMDASAYRVSRALRNSDGFVGPRCHGIDPETGEIERIKLRRHEVLPFFTQRPASLIAMEACGGAHWWARPLIALGHEVRLLPAKAVRPFVLRNKTDAADAQDLDGRPATGNEDGRDQKRISARHPGLASSARPTNEIPAYADQCDSRPIAGVWLSAAGGVSSTAQGLSSHPCFFGHFFKERKRPPHDGKQVGPGRGNPGRETEWHQV